MRWLWIDRFIEFNSGESAIAVKNVSLGEDYLHDHFPGFPVMPCSLVVEGFAQIGGLLVSEPYGFQRRTVLAKVGKARFVEPPRPGDVLTYTAQVLDANAEGGLVSGISRTARGLQGELELFFAHPEIGPDDMFEPEKLLAMLRLLGMYEVGRAADGSPLQVPDYLAQAEAAALAGLKSEVAS